MVAVPPDTGPDLDFAGLSDPSAIVVDTSAPHHSASANRPSTHRQAPTSHSLRKSLNKAAFLLATETGRYPGAVNKELNDVMVAEQRAEADKEQLREALRRVGDQLRALGKPRPVREAGVTFSGEPPF